MHEENLRITIVLIVVSMIAILSFGLVIGQLVDKEYIYETLEIIILFIGLFATFGGAYLGAKIAGDKALEISNEDKAGKIEHIKKKYILYLSNFKDIVVRLRPDYTFYHEAVHSKPVFIIDDIKELFESHDNDLIKLKENLNDLFFDSDLYYFEKKYEDMYQSLLDFHKTINVLVAYNDIYKEVGFKQEGFDEESLNRLNTSFDIMKNIEKNHKIILQFTPFINNRKV
ncbi:MULTISPECIES: hypothetical protein [Staphylococcus]|uniref:hypothetical protein n=2 Tax=Staphylococcus TaxID=1279 RepID=UPI000E06EA72|nr:MULTISPECIES: hypothetical protein [Staphylococcus]MBF2782767.1 hypothetical protein [Staphylococcus saprophyticus]QQT22731.1 hypothetical protein I6J06_12260 [Staphylococcus equorum]SUM23531.1 Uncharacterised protein [Staphylococcus equorum]